MTLQFIGKDPESENGGSPTVWVDPETRELVVQGWIADEATRAECGPSGAIPAREAVVRIPFRMAAILRSACDAAEAPGL